jgi:aminopeptidase-like protein
MKDRASLAEAIEKAKETGRYIKSQMPKGWGFVLVLREFNEEGEGGAMTYLSSIERDGCIKMLKEFIQKVENDEPEISSTN